MSVLSIEMLTSERVMELWPELEPYFEASCHSHEIAKDELDAKDIYVLAATDLATVIAGFADGQLVCVLALQFNMANGKKYVDILALAGSRLFEFRKHYWPSILEWLESNDVKGINAYVPLQRAKVYTSRFGFTKSCAYVRMNLGGY